MPRITTVAWAIPVDVRQSIAHVEAYVEHTTATETFIDCVRAGRLRGQAIGRLAQEVIDMILENVGGPCFGTHRQRWLPRIQCAELRCLMYELESKVEIAEACEEILQNQLLDPNSKNPLRLSDLHSNEHQTGRSEVMKAIENMVVTGPLGGYNTYLFRRFGLQLHYTTAAPDISNRKPLGILAHLVLPSEYQVDDKSSSQSAMIVDYSFVQQPRDRLKAQFETAMRELKLNVSISKHHRLAMFSASLTPVTTRNVSLTALYEDDNKPRECQLVRIPSFSYFQLNISSLIQP